MDEVDLLVVDNMKSGCAKKKETVASSTTSLFTQKSHMPPGKKRDKRPGRTRLMSITKITETERIEKERAYIGKEMSPSAGGSQSQNRYRHPACDTRHVLPSCHDDGGVMLEEPHRQTWRPCWQQQPKTDNDNFADGCYKQPEIWPWWDDVPHGRKIAPDGASATTTGDLGI